MKSPARALVVTAVAAAFLAVFPVAGLAYPPYFTNNCAGCHSNDTATCNGCHHHGPKNLSATPDKVQYKCGETMAVTLNGGTEAGWIRAILYNQDGVEVARATGPTQAGDDSGTEIVEFPVVLVATAPVGIGVYTWEAAWWGSPFDSGNRTAYPHGPEVRVPVEINVVGPSPVEESTWSRIKQLFR
jgi:hypothetical protein